MLRLLGSTEHVALPIILLLAIVALLYCGGDLLFRHRARVATAVAGTFRRRRSAPK